MAKTGVGAEVYHQYPTYIIKFINERTTDKVVLRSDAYYKGFLFDKVELLIQRVSIWCYALCIFQLRRNLQF